MPMGWPAASVPNWPQGMWYPAMTAQQPMHAQALPAYDLVDEGAELVCQIELPGIKREAIELAVSERSILLTAEATPDIDVGALVHVERLQLHEINRRFELPAEVKPGQAKATLRDGILTINLPKAKPTEGAKRIAIS